MLKGINLTDRGNVETHTPTLSQSLNETFGLPYEPLTLCRPMKLFPTSLGLKPHTPQLPSDNFLANLVSGKRTHLAIIREIFGKNFKNFVNFARGEVQTSPKVYAALVQALNGDEELLNHFAKNMRLGLLPAQTANVMRLIETVVNQLASAASSGAGMCPTCRQKRISQASQWWSERKCSLGPPEFRFVDRLLLNTLTVVILPRAFSADWSQRGDPANPLISMCDSGAHPFKNWLIRVMMAYRASDLTSLATKARLDGPSPDSLLQRCGRGEMLTFETIDALTTGLYQPKPLRDLGRQTRSLAFLIDFLIAADSRAQALSWSDAQQIIQDRLLRLREDLHESLAVSRGIPPVVIHSLIGKATSLGGRV
jgi:hypothetical protein